MRFVQYLQEVYVGMGMSNWGRDISFEIFKNPTAKELRSVETEYGIRFIVDNKKKDIYCFDGSALHDDAFDALRFNPGDLRFWTGVGEYRNGKIRAIMIYDSDLKNYPWLRKYITAESK